MALDLLGEWDNVTIIEERQRVLDSERLPYESPTVETLGTLGDLTRGAGDGVKPIVAVTAPGAPGFMAPPDLSVDR